MISVGIAVLQCVVLVLLAPLFSGIVRWLTAKLQTRRGPSIFQDYYDIAKLVRRQDVRTENSTFISRIMPPLQFGCMLVLACGIPMITRFSPMPVMGDLITIIYLLTLPRFFFALAGLDSSDAYAGVGAVREVVTSVLIEPSLMLGLLVAAVACGTTQIGAMGYVIGSGMTSSPVAIVIAGVAFAFACYVEMGNLPYDEPEAEQEIQEGVEQEFSGTSLAMLKVSGTMQAMLMASLFLAVFIPFGSPVQVTGAADIIYGLLLYLVKLLIVFIAAGVISNIVSRVRYIYLGRQTWGVVGVSALAFVLCVLGI